jgi:hypothetical protein
VRLGLSLSSKPIVVVLFEEKTREKEVRKREREEREKEAKKS